MRPGLVILIACGLPLMVARAQDPPPAPGSAGGNSRADEVAALEPAVNTSANRAPAAEAQAAVAPPPAPAPALRAAARPVAIDQLDLGTTSITGNQELPKVLYIVPWKRSDLGDVIGRPVNTLLDEVLAPVDPEVFERHLSYYETLNGTSQEE